MIKVSVIVPVFNGALYIEKALNSLLAQTLDEIEIVVVDDGSTDETHSIVSRIKNNNEKVIFISQDNRGVSVARNTGLMHATGRFIGFLDADDLAHPEMYETMYNAATEFDADWAFCNVRPFSDVGNHDLRLDLKNEVIELIQKRKEEQAKLLHFKYDYANWNKIYLSQIIRANRIEFCEQLYRWEDLLFNLSYLQFSKRLAIIDAPLYQYRFHSGSATKADVKRLAVQYECLCNNFFAFCADRNIQGAYDQFAINRAGACMGVFYQNAFRNGTKFFSIVEHFAADLEYMGAGFFVKMQVSSFVEKIEKFLLVRGKFKLVAFIFTLRNIRSNLKF